MSFNFLIEERRWFFSSVSNLLVQRYSIQGIATKEPEDPPPQDWNEMGSWNLNLSMILYFEVNLESELQWKMIHVLCLCEDWYICEKRADWGRLYLQKRILFCMLLQNITIILSKPESIYLNNEWTSRHPSLMEYGAI